MTATRVVRKQVQPHFEALGSAPSEYRADIDGLRAVAILGVVGFHAAPRLIPGGFVGVDIFFVISGYLISRIILVGVERETFTFSDFYSRRVRRIFPALILVLFFVSVFGWLVSFPVQYQQLGGYVAAGAGFVSNIVLYGNSGYYFEIGVPKGPLLHLWSLGVEEQFYILWPILLFVTRGLGKLQILAMAVIAILSFVLNVAAITSEPLASFYLPSNRLWQLAMGGILAWVQLEGPQSNGKLREITRISTFNLSRPFSHHVRGLLGVTLLGVSYACLNARMEFPGWWAVIPSVGTLLLISAGPNSYVSRYLLMRRPLIYIGLVSYSWYLWHWPLFAFLHELKWGEANAWLISGTVLLSFALAAVTYKFVEAPLRQKNRTRRVTTSGLCFGMGFCGALGLAISIGAIPPRTMPEDVSRYVDALEQPSFGVAGATVNGFTVLGEGPQRILFIGDSTVHHYIPRVARLLAENPNSAPSAVFALAPGCSLAWEMAFLRREDCQAAMESALTYAKTPSVETVVLGGCWYQQFVEFSDWENFGAPGHLKPGSDHAIEQMKRRISNLVAEGKRVYVILQSPVSASFDAHKVVRRSILPPGFRMEPRFPTRAHLLRAIEPISSRVKRASLAAGASTIDPVDSLCSRTVCSGLFDGRPVYSDALHLHPDYVREHVTFLDQLLLNGDEQTPLVSLEQ